VNEEREYTTAQKLAIWLGLLIISWTIVIIIGIIVYKLAVWYIPMVIFVWEIYIQFVYKVYRGTAE